MNSLEVAQPGVTIGFALPSTNRGNKRKENSSEFGVITTRGKTNSATRLTNGEGTRHYSKVPGSATTGNRTGFKLALQQFQVNPQCKIVQACNSAI